MLEWFARTPLKQQLLAGMLEALRLSRAAGCTFASINGGFFTAKDEPANIGVQRPSDMSKALRFLP